ncbi:Wadjet anti-phage system protein JetD domain-containing protein [Parahaliea mediterranea]|uniref:Wadjet anti-phage system protein JetD domain-containing protein n=1 Tax=Parahaliea mediterranea TaxID=651086 RepID=UPI000E2EF38D|nr:Wadjet anti-phage system protein JetD domain-containing protein [Parahaliea mediterranea]
MAAPGWLAEEPWLRKLLDDLLTRLEKPRQRDVTLRVRPGTLPALFRSGEDEDNDYRWQLIEKLVDEYPVFTLQLDRHVAAFDQPYQNAQLRLNPDAENLLREWLDRPRIDPLQQAWEQALARHHAHFADGGASLLALRQIHPDYDPAALIAGFAAVGTALDGTLTLREIAARCFRGDSKFLDQRQDLLHKLYGEQAAAILPRPLLLMAFAPEGFEQLLIVENQDSFLRLSDAPPPGHALLYSGGFRASAERLGSRHTRFAFLPGSHADRFHQRWLSDSLPVYFWGDLDFAGLGILKALRQSLPSLTAWRPGYAPLLRQLQRGLGHPPGQPGKSRQADPLATGCPYADNTLLPALRQYGHFVDQEGVRPDA